MTEATEEGEAAMQTVKNCSELDGNRWILLPFLMRFSLDLNFPSSFNQHFIHWFVYVLSQQLFIVYLLVPGTGDAAAEETKTPALMSLTL